MSPNPWGPEDALCWLAKHCAFGKITEAEYRHRLPSSVEHRADDALRRAREVKREYDDYLRLSTARAR